MKLICMLLFLAGLQQAVAQGRFVTEEFKPLIGVHYKTVAELRQLHNFVDRGGSVISRFDDPETFAGNWFSRESLFVVLFEKVDENNEREILDVLVIENARPAQEIIIGLCTYGDSEMPGLLALVNTKKAKRIKAIRAWNLNRDKVRIEPFAAEKVTCQGMIGED